MGVRTFALASAAMMALLSSAGGASADDAAVKYRQSVMEAVGGHTRALGAIVKGEVTHTADFKAHAAALDGLAAMAGHIFPTAPEGETSVKTEVLPAVWEKPEDFKMALASFSTAAANLAKAAAADGATPKGIAPAFGDLVKSCKGCHDSFKKKD